MKYAVAVAANMFGATSEHLDQLDSNEVLVVRHMTAETPQHLFVVLQDEGGGTSESQKTEVVAEAEIQSLVTQLGADTYAERQAAHMQLQSFGSKIFERLLQETNNEDCEVRGRIKQLLQTVGPEWVQHNDEPALAATMHSYSLQNKLSSNPQSINKKTFLHRFNQLTTENQITGLGRVVRFDLQDRFSKLAALQLMQLDLGDDESVQRDRRELMRSQLQSSSRVGANWMRTFFALQQDQQVAMNEWQQMIDAESDFGIRFELYKLQASYLKQHGNTKAAQDAMRSMVDCVVPESHIDVSKIINYLHDQQEDALLVELAANNPAAFSANPVWLRYAHEACVRTGETEFALNFGFEMIDRFHAEEPDEVLGNAALLRHFGYFNQANRLLTESSKLTSGLTKFKTMVFSVNTLQSQGKYREAAEVLKILCDQPFAQEVTGSFKDEYEEFTEAAPSHIAYLEALSAFEAGDTEQYNSKLLDMLHTKQVSAEMLAALSGIEVNEKFAEIVDGLIEADVQKMERDIAQQEVQFSIEPEAKVRLATAHNIAASAERLASVYCAINQPQKALHFAQKAYQYVPHSAQYLNTLAYSHFVEGDTATALQYQREALELSPHDPLFIRQLQLFTQDSASAEYEATKATVHHMRLLPNCGPRVVETESDVIELNHNYDACGRFQFNQVIFIEQATLPEQNAVFAWRLLKRNSQIPKPYTVTNQLTGAKQTKYVMALADGNVIHVIRSSCVEESYTQFDPEMANRKVVSKEHRTDLPKIAKK